MAVHSAANRRGLQCLRHAQFKRDGLRLLSVVLGIFLICMGYGKLGWAVDSSLLEDQLRRGGDRAPTISKWYIDWFAMPGVPLFARLVLLGELSTGLAAGGRLPPALAALAALLMVLNFHFAMGLLFTSRVLDQRLCAAGGGRAGGARRRRPAPPVLRRRREPR